VSTVAADLTLSRSAKENVTHVEANTDRGTTFVDSYATSDVEVVDAGRIVVRDDLALERAALDAGLRVEHDVIDDDSEN
jgi:hypothetical protein